jgi:hypothetical protein
LAATNAGNGTSGALGTSVSGYSTGVHGGGYYGVCGSGNYGVYGAGIAYGVYGSASTYGVYGTSGSYGVYGSGSSYGVRGENSIHSSFGELGTAVSGTSAGVHGGGYYGVYGSGNYGVYGAGIAYGVYGDGSTYGVYGDGSTYGVYAEGNLGASGTKSAVVALPDDRVVELYSMESPELWFEDFGAGELREGAAEVALDPTFALTVNTEADYHVFLTPNGDCEGLYVTNKTATGFQVRELRGGKSNVAFDYRIAAKRRGYESVRTDQLETDAETVQAIREQGQRRPGERRKLILPKKAEVPKAPPEPPKS